LNLFYISVKEIVLEVIKLCSTHLHLVVDAYTHALTAKYPKYRYVVGNDAKYFLLLLSYFPEWLSDFILSWKISVPLAEEK